MEFAAAILAAKPGRCGFISLLTAVTPNCDCMHDPGKPFVADIGALASRDMVAVDQAALDLVERAGKAPGGRSVAAAAPGTEIGVALELAERMGLGSRRYELVEI